MLRSDARPRRSLRASCGVTLAVLLALTACTRGSGGDLPTPVGPASPASTGRDLTRQEAIALGRERTLRIEVTTCTGEQVGSGFIVGPRLIATAANVVNGAQTVSVRGMHGGSLGTVIGIDRERDVALVRTRGKVEAGDPLVFADGEPQQGDDIVTIGYPEGRPQTPTVGTVSRLGQSVDIGNRRLHDLVQFDAAANPASSGGPLLDLHGGVVGLTEGQNDSGANLNYAVSGKTARPLLAAWTDSPSEVFPNRCPKSDNVIQDRSKSPDGPGIAFAIGQYYNNTNAAVAARHDDPYTSLDHYYAAYNMLSGPLLKHLGSFKEFRDARLDVHYSTGRIVSVRRVDEVTDSAEVTFRRTQPAKGGKCRHYHYRVQMRLASGRWMLDDRDTLSGNGERC